MRRRDLYERERLLAKIEGETERAQCLLAQREALREQRKAANMEASFQRQKLMQARTRPPLNPSHLSRAPPGVFLCDGHHCVAAGDSCCHIPH